MPGVITQRDRLAIDVANAALRAEEDELRAEHLGNGPAHAGVLRQAEDVAAGPIAEHFLGEGERAGRPDGVRHEAVDGRDVVA